MNRERRWKSTLERNLGRSVLYAMTKTYFWFIVNFFRSNPDRVKFWNRYPKSVRFIFSLIFIVFAFYEIRRIVSHRIFIFKLRLVVGLVLSRLYIVGAKYLVLAWLYREIVYFRTFIGVYFGV